VAHLPQSKRDAIKQRLHENIPHIAIAEEMSVSIQTVKNYSSNMKHHDAVLLPSISRTGRPPALTRKIIDVFTKKQCSYFTNSSMLLLILFLEFKGFY